MQHHIIVQIFLAPQISGGQVEFSDLDKITAKVKSSFIKK